MPITHLFVSPKADGADDSVVQPDDWNDDHIIGSIELPYAGLLTVAAGVIAVTGSFHSVASESGGSDQVDTINGGIDGMVSLLRPDTDAQVIDLMHGTGNIEVQGEDDIRLDNTEHVAWLVYDGTLGKWLVSNPGTAAHTHASSSTGGIMANPRLTGYLQIAEDVGMPAPAANTIRLGALDDGGVTKLYYRASDGTVYGPLVGYTDAEAVAAAKTVKLDDFTTPDDNADLNATTSKHGLLLKLGGGTTNFLRADGAWAAPAGGAGGIPNAPDIWIQIP